MKNYAQCLLCRYVFGRSCKKKNQVIPDEIYNNTIVCEEIESLEDDVLDCEDSCCNENSRYYEKMR